MLLDGFFLSFLSVFMADFLQLNDFLLWYDSSDLTCRDKKGKKGFLKFLSEISANSTFLSRTIVISFSLVDSNFFNNYFAGVHPSTLCVNQASPVCVVGNEVLKNRVVPQAESSTIAEELSIWGFSVELSVDEGESHYLIGESMCCLLFTFNVEQSYCLH